MGLRLGLSKLAAWLSGQRGRCGVIYLLVCVRTLSAQRCGMGIQFFFVTPSRQAHHTVSVQQSDPVDALFTERATRGAEEQRSRGAEEKIQST